MKLKGKKISEVSQRFDLTGKELLPFAQDGENGSMSIDTIASYAYDKEGGDFTSRLAYDVQVPGVELIADRAEKDALGNIITNTYLTRSGAKKAMNEAIKEQLPDAIANINDGFVTPNMLSEETKQLFGAETITNFPDNEDITVNASNQLTLADKEYNPITYSGMGSKKLRKNMINGVNILTQNMLNKQNTIYVILYDFDLNGEEITIPEGCVLDFQGGSFSNGIIINYRKYVKASTLNFKTGNSNKVAIHNAEYLIKYINLGFNIELDDVYYFNNANENIINNDIRIKNGGMIVYPQKDVNIKPIYVGKGCTFVELKNIKFDTNLEKDGTRLVTPIFHVKSEQESTPHIETLSVNRCSLDGVCVWFHKLDEFDYNNIPCGIDYVEIYNCTIKNSQSGSFSFDNTPHKKVVIINNKITDMKRSVFRISTENAYTTPERGYVYYCNNIAENNEIIIPNEKWGTQYFTPILAEHFEHTFIENNTFNNLIINSPVEQVYAFYVGGRNVYIRNNIQYNVINLGRQDLNEIFKNKSGVNKYVENNIYKIDENYIKSKYPDYAGYDFTSMQVQFMTVNALISADNPIGDYIVRRNDIVIPCKLKFGTPRWYVSKDLYFTDNSIECNNYEGIILTFEGNQSGVNVFIENNKLLANNPTGAHLLWFGENVDFNVFIRHNYIQGLRRIATDGLTGHCVEEYNTYDNCSHNATVNANHFGKNARFENNTIINNNEYAFYNIASSESLTASFNFKEGRTSFNWIILYDGNNNNSIKIKHSYYNSNNDFIEDSAILVFNKETNQLIIKRSSLFESTLELNGNYGQIPLSEVEHGTNPCYLVQDNGTLRLAIRPNTDTIFVKIEKNIGISDRYPNIKGAYSTRNLQQLLHIVPDNRLKLFNNRLNNYVNYINNAWRNNDGTRLDKVIYVSNKSHFVQPNATYIITDDVDLEGISQDIPINSTLEFRGGKITNGTIKLQSTKIIPNGCVVTDYITAIIDGTYSNGQCLFNTILNKPTWWTGTKWVDATGADV